MPSPYISPARGRGTSRFVVTGWFAACGFLSPLASRLTYSGHANSTS